ncbi:MAG: FAD synthetase family protein [Clostridia bacterium]|nr:FAD synthetase family protein [Clostridia bacterium]
MQSVIALGTFDGMHLGHRTVISRAVEKARQMNAKAMVYTFSSIPRALFADAPKMLMTAEERKKEMLKMGVSEVVMVDFTKEIAEMSPEAFVRMLYNAYHPCAIVAGEDYSFGYRAQGNMEHLKKYAEEMGFEVITVETVRVKMSDGSFGSKISSTDIRKALEDENILLAERLSKGEIL